MTRTRVTLEEAARRFCAAKDEAHRLRKTLRRCEIASPADLSVGDSGAATCRAQAADPDEGWCDACRANHPVVEELRMVKRRAASLLASMRRVYQRELGKEQ